MTPVAYRDGAFEMREAVVDDLIRLAPEMRGFEKEELWRAAHETPIEGLMNAFNRSEIHLTLLYAERPVAIFGVIPESLLANRGQVWMLTAIGIDECKIHFLKRSRDVIRALLRLYPTLYNWVDIHHVPCIRWLRWVGAEIGQAVNFGPDNLPFLPFTLREGL